MIIVLNGEGPTDLGECNNSNGFCQDESFDHGPMTLLVDQIAESVLKYSLLETPGSYRYFNRKYISVWSKANQPRLRPTRGKYSPAELGIYRVSAFVLAEIARNLSVEEGRPTAAVLFRDADGTNTSARSHWIEKYRAINDGFKLAHYPNGVAMLPMPKSEAWLICAARKPIHEDCHKLETLPGNDAAPRSAKFIFEEIRGQADSAQSICEWLASNDVKHHEACNMPSYLAFRDDMIKVFKNMRT